MSNNNRTSIQGNNNGSTKKVIPLTVMKEIRQLNSRMLSYLQASKEFQLGKQHEIGELIASVSMLLAQVNEEFLRVCVEAELVALLLDSFADFDQIQHILLLFFSNSLRAFKERSWFERYIEILPLLSISLKLQNQSLMIATALFSTSLTTAFSEFILMDTDIKQMIQLINERVALQYSNKNKKLLQSKQPESQKNQQTDFSKLIEQGKKLNFFLTYASDPKKSA